MLSTPVAPASSGSHGVAPVFHGAHDEDAEAAMEVGVEGEFANMQVKSVECVTDHSEAGDDSGVDSECPCDDASSYPSSSPHSSAIAAALPPPTAEPWGKWTDDDISKLKIRGPTFMEDKIKIPCGNRIYRLAHVDMFYTPKGKETVKHCASRPGNWAYKYMERREQLWRQAQAAKSPQGKSGASSSSSSSSSPSPSQVDHPYSADASRVNHLSPLIIMNFLFPGPSSKNMNLILYFERVLPPAEVLRQKSYSRSSSKVSSAKGAKKASAEDTELECGSPNSKSQSVNSDSVGSSSSSIDIDRVSAFDTVLSRFIDGSDAFRDARLKIIPRIAEGSWIVKKGVGCVPAILGKKIKLWYYRDVDKNYLEVRTCAASAMHLRADRITRSQRVDGMCMYVHMCV